MLVSICIAKIIATAISIGFGFGGGVFSPALVIGAMLGGGGLAADTRPEVSAQFSILKVRARGRGQRRLLRRLCKDRCEATAVAARRC